jgi:hypothetical protein
MIVALYARASSTMRARSHGTIKGKFASSALALAVAQVSCC